jgi:hypothetical protein
MAFLSGASSRSVGKDAWLALRTSTQDCDIHGLYGAYDAFFSESSEDDGPPLLSLPYLERLSRKKIWKKNSHIDVQDRGFTDHTDGEIGHYNPAFVSWAFSTFVPGRSDSNFRRQTQVRYDTCLAPYSRLAWATLQEIKARPSCSAFLVKQYKTDSSPQRRAPDGYAWQRQCVAEGETANDPQLLFHPDDEASAATSPDFLIGFWLRREIDGSRPSFEAGLRRLLRTYDAQWLAGFGKTPTRVLISGDDEPSEAQALKDEAVSDKARARLLGPALAAQGRDREARVERALATCRSFQDEVSRRKAEIRHLAQRGRRATAQGAVDDLQSWISDQQSSSTGMGAALNTLRDVMDSERLTDTERMQLARSVQGSCSG